jgi:hypothetical protein
MLPGEVSRPALGASNLVNRPRSSRNPGTGVRGLVLAPVRARSPAPRPLPASPASSPISPTVCPAIGAGVAASAVPADRAVSATAPTMRTPRRRRRRVRAVDAMLVSCPASVGFPVFAPATGPDRSGVIQPGAAPPTAHPAHARPARFPARRDRTGRPVASVRRLLPAAQGAGVVRRRPWWCRAARTAPWGRTPAAGSDRRRCGWPPCRGRRRGTRRRSGPDRCFR